MLMCYILTSYLISSSFVSLLSSEIVQTTLKAAHRLLIVRTTLIQRLAYVNLLQMLSKVYLQSTRPSWNVAKTIIRGILQPALLRH